MAIIRIDVAESISSNPFALQQVVDQIIDQIDDLNTGTTGGGGGGGGDVYTLTATDGDGEVNVNLLADAGDDSSVVLRAGNGITINESGGTITFTGADGPDLGNYVTVNTSTGEIQAGTTTFQYLYRYLHIAFATDGNGSDFTTDPSTITSSNIFIGVFNSSLTTPPDEPGDYSYREFVWSSEHNVFLRTVGGHQIEFLTSLQAIIPDASPYNTDSDNPLDFDVLQINNGNISDGAVSVEKLSIDQLSAITADVGDLTAGVIRGGNLTGFDPANNADGAFGSYMSLTNGDVLFGDANTHFRFDAAGDEISLIGDIATTNQMEYVLDAGANNERIMVNSNTFSNETNTSNSHYAADGLISTTAGSFFVGHAETPINDSTRAIDTVNSTGIQVATRQLSENFTSSAVSTLGTVNFSNGTDGGGRVVWADFIETLVATNNANIVASKYENRGLSNIGNSVILGTDAADRITANYPGGTPLDFTQFSTGKAGSTSGQAVISNNQNLDLPAGTYAISVEELTAERRRVIYDLSGMVGQITGETFSDSFDEETRITFDGDLVTGSTVINAATTATGDSYIDAQFTTDDSISFTNYLYLLTGSSTFDSIINENEIYEIDVDSSRNFNATIVDSNDISITATGIRRVDLRLNVFNSGGQMRIWLVNSAESSNNADSFIVDIPSGFNDNSSLSYLTTYDRGAPSGLTLEATSAAAIPSRGYIPMKFNETITTNDELLTRFETEFERITSITNNGTDDYTGQEVRLDNINVQAIVTNNAGSGFSDFTTANSGTEGNFAASGAAVGAVEIAAHKFGIDPNSSNSVYGGWMQGQRFVIESDSPGFRYNTGVNGVYDQSTGNFDVYGSRQFNVIASNTDPGDFDLIPTNNSNTEFVRSNYVLSDTTSNAQTGIIIVSSVGPMTLTGEFYEDSQSNNSDVVLADGAGIVMQYKEIQS